MHISHALVRPLPLPWEYYRILGENREQSSTQRWATAAKLSHPSILLTKSPSLSPLSLSPCKSLLVGERRMSALPTSLQLLSSRQRTEDILCWTNTLNKVPFLSGFSSTFQSFDAKKSFSDCTFLSLFQHPSSAYYRCNKKKGICY